MKLQEKRKNSVLSCNRTQSKAREMNHSTAGTEDSGAEDHTSQTNGSGVEGTAIENPTCSDTTSGTTCLSCATLQSKVDNLSHQVSELRELHASEQRTQHLQLETLINQATASIGILQKECIESKNACHSLVVVNTEIQAEKQSLVDELEVTKKENKKLQYKSKVKKF